MAWAVSAVASGLAAADVGQGKRARKLIVRKPETAHQLKLALLEQMLKDAGTKNLSFAATLETLADLELEARNRGAVARGFHLSRLYAPVQPHFPLRLLPFLRSKMTCKCTYQSPEGRILV